MDKPEVLYRGSPRKDATLFIPKEKVGTGITKRLVVSSSANMAEATKFLVPVEQFPCLFGIFGEVQYFLCGNEGIFRKIDNGGAVYSLPGNTFYYDFEARTWVSAVPVKPISHEVFSSGLNAMVDSGVQVYFLDPKILENCQESADRGLKLLRSHVSENMRLDRNIINLPTN